MSLQIQMRANRSCTLTVPYDLERPVMVARIVTSCRTLRAPSFVVLISCYTCISMIKTDFFEARSTAYAKSSALVDDL